MVSRTKSAAAKGVALETATEDWRIMSAEIAYALWSDPARVTQRNEADEAPDAWEGLAAEYRVRVRAVLRQILSDGIRFERGPEIAESEQRDDAWWNASARLAWLLWLRKRREKNAANEPLERVAWTDEAVAYRAYVRSALKRLGAKGIHVRG